MSDPHNLRKVVDYIGGEPVVTFVKGDAPGHEFRGNQYTGGGGEPLQEGKITEGMRVKATERYGGQAGIIADAMDGKSFVVVRHDDGSKASYHYSDLRTAEDEEDED